MNKALIFTGVGGFAVGGAVGFLVGRFFFKKKVVAQADARVQEAVDLYNQYLEEAYQDMENYDDEINPPIVAPEELEEEETKEEIIVPKKPGRIICKPLSEWYALTWDDFDVWGHDELIYFPDDERTLTDQYGNKLEPLGKYIGNNIDRFIRKDNVDPDDEENENRNMFYIWNEPLEMHYLVHKEDNITRDEFFNYK